MFIPLITSVTATLRTQIIEILSSNTKKYMNILSRNNKTL